MAKPHKHFRQHPKRLVGTFWVNERVLKVIKISKQRAWCVVVPGLEIMRIDIQDLLLQSTYVGREIPDRSRNKYVVAKNGGSISEILGITGNEVTLSVVRGDLSQLSPQNLWEGYHIYPVVGFFDEFRHPTEAEIQDGETVYQRWMLWIRAGILEHETEIREFCDTSWTAPEEPPDDKPERAPIVEVPISPISRQSSYQILQQGDGLDPTKKASDD